MLVLSRKDGERFWILAGEQWVSVELCAAIDGRARLGITGPKNVRVLREELALAEGLIAPEDVDAVRGSKRAAA